MCKNWEAMGACPFMKTCSFAHGEHELVKKKHLPPNFKTKACVQFHTTGYCAYGTRCQFLHSQYSITDKVPQKKAAQKQSNAQILAENARLSLQRAAQIQDDNHDKEFFLDGAIYVNVFSEKIRPRLNVFEKIYNPNTYNNKPYNNYRA
jgi:hypothetical protein